MSRDNLQTLPVADNDTADTAELAEDTDETAVPAIEDAPVQPRRARRVLWVVAMTAFLALGAALGYTLFQQSELHRLQSEAVSTTRDYLVAMASFDYQDLDANKGTIMSGSTPDFGKKYDEMVAALRDIVVTSKGVAQASAEHVAVESFDDHSVTVIGFVDQQVTNVTAPEGNKQRYRMVVTLVRDGDRWLVNNVETV